MDKLGKMAGRLLQTVKPSPFANLGYPYMYKPNQKNIRPKSCIPISYEQDKA